MRKLILLVLLAGCAAQKPGEPPAVAFGKDACARCGMIVSEDRFAAGYVADDGRAVAYDDLGELLAALEERPGLRERAWARDLEGGGWLRLSEARVETVPGLATPMGTGTVAFRGEREAKAFLEARAKR